MSKTHDNHDLLCDHKIKYCKKCDTAYCIYNGCEAEWTNNYPFTWTTTTPIYNNDWTTNGTANNILCASECAHS